MPILRVSDAFIHYETYGQGIPIIFIHPPVLTGVNFTYQAKELSEFFQVITFDMRGHGKSSNSRQSVTYPLVVEDMVALLDRLDIKKAFICGYSMGGSIVLEFLLSRPERAFGGIVIGGLSEVNDVRLRGKIALGAAIAASGDVGLDSLSLSVAWTNSDTRELFWKMYKEARKGCARNVKEYYQYGLHYNCTDRLGEIQAPVQLVYGKNDKNFYSYAEMLHNRIPDNQLTFVKDVKHHIPTKASLELNDLIRQFIYTHQHTVEDEEAAIDMETETETLQDVAVISGDVDRPAADVDVYRQ
jgi:pimeloyl-ACP methyl ester carboxylesterase